MPAVPEWDEEDHLTLMKKLNIKKSILSISSPGTHLVHDNPELAKTVTRDVNAYGADLKKRNSDQFGYFASLPIPDVALCLSEIETCTQEGCDGFVMLTNGHGIYPGDAVLDAVFDELNRRKAILFFHPTTPTCPCSPQAQANGQSPQKAAPFAGKLPNPMLEFFFDTARIVTNLFLSGTIQRCPDIQFIFAHCGGAMPPLLSRFTGFSSLVHGPWHGTSEEEARAALNRQIWFDMAGFSFPRQIKGLTEGCGVGHERLLYGSDYPFTKAGGVEMLAGQMDEGAKELFNEDQIQDMYHKNAERLFGAD